MGLDYAQFVWRITMKANEYFNALNNTLGFVVAIQATMSKYHLSFMDVVWLATDYGGGGVV